MADQETDELQEFLQHLLEVQLQLAEQSERPTLREILEVLQDPALQERLDQIEQLAGSGRQGLQERLEALVGPGRLEELVGLEGPALRERIRVVLLNYVIPSTEMQGEKTEAAAPISLYFDLDKF